jgi:WD40 repeat protein
MKRTFFAVIVSSLFFASYSPCQDVSFVKEVAPILKEHCFACHNSKKKNGKYDMSTFEKLLAGGSNGDAVVAHKPEESDLYTLIVTNEERRMPPADQGTTVPKEKAMLIKKWIQQGAKVDQGLANDSDIVRELRKRWKPPLPKEHYSIPAVVNAVVFSPDGKKVLTSGVHEILIWDAENGKLLQRLQTRSERTYAMLFTSDKLKLVAAGGRPGMEGDVVVYDLSDSTTQILDGVNNAKVKLATLWESDDVILSLALSADKKRLAAGGTDRTVRIWKQENDSFTNETNKFYQTIENHADWVMSVAFSPDGKLLFSAGRDKLAKIWDIEKKEPVLTVPDHQAIVYSVVVDQKGKTASTVGADKLLRTWDIADGKQVQIYYEHSGEVFKVAGQPDSHILATTSADRTVRIWDKKADKNNAFKTLTEHNDYVYSLAFSPDGKKLAAGAFNGKVVVWNTGDWKKISQWEVKP